MKNISKFILLSSLLVTLFWSCKKEENKNYYLGGSPIILTSLDTSLHLSAANALQNSVTFSWTNPGYKFTTGISSQNVIYQLQIDTLGANFTNPKMFVLSISSDLYKTFTVDELNSYLANTMGLATGVKHTLQVRIVSTLAANQVPLYSNTLQFTGTPYAPPPLIAPPTAGTLWLTGDASTSGFANPLPAPFDVSQKFTKVSNTLYELTVDLPGGGAYKFIQEQGVWGTQYHMTTGTWQSGEFEQKDAEPKFPGPAAAGKYKISVDFQKGKYTVVKL